MKLRLFAALLTLALLAACGFDSTPQSSGRAASGEKATDGGKKSD